MSEPDSVTGLTTSGELRLIELSWRPLPWSTVVDHYRVYAVEGTDRGALKRPRARDLLAKTVYPHFVHRGRSAAGETWSYTVVTVDAAGNSSDPSKIVLGSSTTSITRSGDPLAVVGEFDARTLEFQYAPSSYPSIPTSHPDAVINIAHGPDAATRWPYLLPGPGDAWAGRKVYTLNWTIELAAAPAKPALAVWLVDTTRLGGRLDIAVNGTPAAERTLIAGGTAGSRQGDANLPGTTLVPSYHEFDLAADLFRAGSNTVRFTLAQGGWVAWDAIGLYEL
jgi:hypothetical protein